MPVVEAKPTYSTPGEGLQQAKEYAEILDLKFAYATNGHGIVEFDSNWREILEYFEPAFQIGMTATPKRQDNIDTYRYFGNPIYTYSLRQGIDDGFSRAAVRTGETRTQPNEHPPYTFAVSAAPRATAPLPTSTTCRQRWTR